jgi:putative transposase
MHKRLPPRWDSKGAWYFVTVVTHERYPYFEVERACQVLLDACRSVWGRHPYRLGALVILPDHWHALIKPLEKEVIESIVGSIKQRVFHASRQDGSTAFPCEPSSKMVSAHPCRPSSKMVAPPSTAAQVIRWQARFMDHRIRSEADYFQHIEYMRLNPYKHQLVKDEKEPWPWWFVHQKNPFA